MESGTYCKNCDLKLDGLFDAQASPRIPCPDCGETARAHRETATAKVLVRARAQGQVLPADRLEKFECWYEKTDSGQIIVYTKYEDTEQRVPIGIGDGDDPDSAAMEVAVEFLKKLNNGNSSD